MTQPDGTEITVRLYGDESGHYYLSDDGYPLRRDDDGFFYYRTGFSGSTASVRGSRQIGPHTGRTGVSRHDRQEIGRKPHRAAHRGHTPQQPLPKASPPPPIPPRQTTRPGRARGVPLRRHQRRRSHVLNGKSRRILQRPAQQNRL